MKVLEKDKKKNWSESKLRECGRLSGMKGRCYNTHTARYKNYGGRGITVCDRWMNKETGLDNFIHDMGEWPGKGYTIDRIDVNGNYCPENCRWATEKEQSRNRVGTRKVLYNGEMTTVRELSEITNIPYDILIGRVRLGWTVDRVVNEAIKMTAIRKRKMFDCL